MLGKKRRFRDQADGPATIIGETASIEGALGGSGHFVIEGHVNGDSQLQGMVTLAATGRWTGSLEATDVVIAGTLDGDLRAKGKVEITPTARIDGSVTGASIAIAEGAVIAGGINVTHAPEVHQFVEQRER